jgi:hypothetical protein
VFSKLLMYHSYIFTATIKLGDVVHAAILKEHTRGICATKFRNVYAKKDISLAMSCKVPIINDHLRFNLA